MFKKPISVAFAPNIERDDVSLSVRLLFDLLIKSKKYDQSVNTLETKFGQFFGTKHAVAFSSARAALYFSLKALKLPTGSEVLIQAFTCVAVPNSIIWAGLKPIYIDIEESTLNMDPNLIEKKITPSSKAIIIQHTFGMPAKIDKILEIAKKHHLVVIEDCAHVIGAKYNEKLVGAFGDVSVFSFGRDKSISSVFGGLAISNNIKIAHNLSVYQQKLESTPVGFVIQQLLYPIIYYACLPFYEFFIGRALLKMSSYFGFLSKAVTAKESAGKKMPFIEYKLSPYLVMQVLHQFKKLERFNEHRKTVSERYKKFLKLNKSEFSASNGYVPIYLRYPLLVKNKQATLTAAKKEGIHLGDWYNSPVATGSQQKDSNLSVFFYKMGDCPIAEAVSKNIINLPTHINIGEKEIYVICSFLSKFI